MLNLLDPPFPLQEPSLSNRIFHPLNECNHLASTHQYVDQDLCHRKPNLDQESATENLSSINFLELCWCCPYNHTLTLWMVGSFSSCSNNSPLRSSALLCPSGICEMTRSSLSLKRPAKLASVELVGLPIDAKLPLLPPEIQQEHHTLRKLLQIIRYLRTIIQFSKCYMKITYRQIKWDFISHEHFVSCHFLQSTYLDFIF